MKPNQMTDKQFSLWLGEVLLGDGPYQHVLTKSAWTGYARCLKCGKDEKHSVMAKLECPIKTEIPLDWPNAKKHQWAIIKEMGEIVFMEALGDIYTVSEYCTKITCDFESWLILHAQPRDYLQAAAELKEKQKLNSQ